MGVVCTQDLQLFGDHSIFAYSVLIEEMTALVKIKKTSIYFFLD